MLNVLDQFRKDPKKSKAERKEQLEQLFLAGRSDVLITLYKEAKGIPAGTSPAVGTLIRTEMIPEILAHEYPNE